MQHTSRILASASIAALLTLAGCNNEPETVNAASGADPQAKDLAKAPPVTLPPAIKASKTYRCKDNSLVYVSFMTDNVTATVRDKQEEPPVATLKAPAPGEKFVAEGGFELTGDGGSTITYTSPDSGTQSCKA